jgi:Mg2+ and Co2+ transporter CorA
MGKQKQKSEVQVKKAVKQIEKEVKKIEKELKKNTPKKKKDSKEEYKLKEFEGEVLISLSGVELSKRVKQIEKSIMKAFSELPTKHDIKGISYRIQEERNIENAEFVVYVNMKINKQIEERVKSLLRKELGKYGEVTRIAFR